MNSNHKRNVNAKLGGCRVGMVRALAVLIVSLFTVGTVGAVDLIKAVQKLPYPLLRQRLLAQGQVLALPGVADATRSPPPRSPKSETP